MQVVIRWDKFPAVQKRQNVFKRPRPDDFAISPDGQVVRNVREVTGGVQWSGRTSGAMGGVKCGEGGAFRRSAVPQHHGHHHPQRAE